MPTVTQVTKPVDADRCASHQAGRRDRSTDQVTKPIVQTVEQVTKPIVQTVDLVTKPVTDTLENLPGITLPAITVPPIQLGPIDTGAVLPPVTVPSIHVGGPKTPTLPIPRGATPGLGGAARSDALVPTGAPFPQITDPASFPIAPSSLAAVEHDAGSQAASRGASAPSGPAASRASGSAPSTPAPFDVPAAPQPAAPAPSTTSGSGDGPNRAPTLLLDFAILCAAIALAHEISRGIGRYVRLPRSQFLTVLIERPG